MSRPRRRRNAEDSTREAGEDRSGAPARRPETESHAETPSTSEEADPLTSEDTGGSAGEDKKEVVAAESTTKAAAIVKTPKPKRAAAVCPHCHERRYKPEQIGTTVKCINCRVSVVLR